jgi:hypothetical protein
VCGFIEPLPEDSSTRYEFSNEMVGTVIPPEYYPACEKGFREAANAGALIGAPVEVSSWGWGVCVGGGWGGACRCSDCNQGMQGHSLGHQWK